MPKLILSCDGGGLRGMTTAVVLSRLTNKFPWLIDDADLLAGTSTGALIIAAIADGMSTTDIIEAYRDLGTMIFNDERWFDSWFRAKYQSRNASRAFRTYFPPNRLLRDMKRKVLIPTVDLCKTKDGRRYWDGHFYHNLHTDENHRDMATPICKILQMTTAAPTYFPSVDGHIDGGVFANNPSMCALAQVMSTSDGELPYLLSLGTGRIEQCIQGSEHDWGKLQWGSQIVSLIMGGSAGLVDYQCRQILGSKYNRVDTWLNQIIELDDVDALDVLCEIGHEIDLSGTEDWLNEYKSTMANK